MAGLEASTPPLRLDSGDYIHFYAGSNVSWWDLAAVCTGGHTSGQYMVGFIIMDGSDPRRILQRSPPMLPLMAPLDQNGRAWEIGAQSQQLCNTGNVIFLPTAVRMAAKGHVRLWFGAADAVVGTAVVNISHL